jgi:hypothetical protein
MLLSQDSTGLIRGFISPMGWVPLYEKKANYKFWLMGMMDYEFIGVKLPNEEMEPSVNPRRLTATEDIDLPLIKSLYEEDLLKKFKNILTKRLIVQHEKYRREKWFKHKFSREKNNPLYRYSRSIWDESELIKKEEEIEKAVVEIFRELLVKNHYERALIVARTLMCMNKTLQLAIMLCNKLEVGAMAENLGSILNVE